jgi:hypothetical protein
MIDLTRIKQDMARYEEMAAMPLHEYVSTVKGTEVSDLRQRLLKAVWPLVKEVERLQTKESADAT